MYRFDFFADTLSMGTPWRSSGGTVASAPDDGCATAGAAIDGGDWDCAGDDAGGGACCCTICGAVGGGAAVCCDDCSACGDSGREAMRAREYERAGREGEETRG